MDEGGVVTSQVSQVKCAAYGTHNTYLWVLHLDIIPGGTKKFSLGVQKGQSKSCGFGNPQHWARNLNHAMDEMISGR